LLLANLYFLFLSFFSDLIFVILLTFFSPILPRSISHSPSSLLSLRLFRVFVVCFCFFYCLKFITNFIWLCVLFFYICIYCFFFVRCAPTFRLTLKHIKFGFCCCCWKINSNNNSNNYKMYIN